MMTHSEKTIPIDGVNGVTFMIREDHTGTPCIFFNGFDAKEMCDGFSYEEITRIIETLTDTQVVLKHRLQEWSGEPTLFEATFDAD